MTTHEVLVAARNTVARGWTRRAMSDATGRCAWGACTFAYAPHREAYDGAMEALVVALHACGMQGAESWVSLAIWNDAEGRTKDEVLGLFDRAIAATAPSPDLSFIRDPAKIEVA